MRVEIDYIHLNHPEYNMGLCSLYLENQLAVAYSMLKQTQPALEAIRRAEAVYDPHWDEDGSYTPMVMHGMYAKYNIALGNYEKALEHYKTIRTWYEKTQYDTGIRSVNQFIANIYFEQGDYKAAAEAFHSIIQRKDSVNNERFYSQINELRTIYELDKAELEAERRLNALRRQRLINIGLASACIALILIAALTVWSRRKIAAKNIGLYRQIKEQDSLREEYEQLSNRYDLLAQSLPPTPENGQLADLPNFTGNRQQRRLVARFHDYLLNGRNYAKPATNLDEQITALGTNRTYFFDAIKVVTKKTPVEFINAVRLEEAKQMLESRFELNIELIAEQCGFSSRSTFYRLFRERYQINPSEYRKLALSVF
jgi:AraC-like DNA-binding protein/cell division protein FtsB